MIKVYFESNSHAELVVTFETEEIYAICFPKLEEKAIQSGLIITESVEEETQSEIEKSIIDKANELCEKAFMDFPDYDKENPFTTLADALTIVVFDTLQIDEFDTSEIYDFLNQKLK